MRHQHDPLSPEPDESRREPKDSADRADAETGGQDAGSQEKAGSEGEVGAQGEVQSEGRAKDGVNAAPPLRTSLWGGHDAGRPAALRMAGAGLELAASTLAMAGLGYVIDTTRGHATPYATIAGTLVGFSLGMYRLIAMARKTLDD